MKLGTYATAIALLGAMAFCAGDAEAACDTSGSDKAYGDFWIERDSNCDCLIYMRQFDCVASGGYRTAYDPELITTLTGSCDTACEATSGYDAAIQDALDKYATTAGNYECDTTFTDNDQDGYGACIDEDDDDPRVWVKIDEDETICDGVDNDNDGTADDGITSCSEDTDHKRIRHRTNTQGNAAGRVDLIDGNLTRVDQDVSVQGPHGPLTLTRHYDSRRDSADGDVGIGWTHSFAVYLEQMPTEDGRWRVQTRTGEMQYFRCESFDGEPDDIACAIDDHRPRGNLRRESGVFYFYPGDGTTYRFDDTEKNGRRAYDRHETGASFVLSTAETDSSGRITKVISANTSIYLHFTYGTYGLDEVRINSTTGNKVLDYDVDSSSLLTKVKFASALNTIDTDTFVEYTYDADDNLENVKQKLDASTTLTVATYDYDASDRITSIKDATKDFTVAYTNATSTKVTYNVEASGNDDTDFTHNGLWLTTRDSHLQVGGDSRRTIVRDEHGRVTCFEADDSRMTKFSFTDAMVADQIDVYGKTGTCASGGTIAKTRWFDWSYDTNRQSWRRDWERSKSVYSPASDCTGATLPSGCRETKYDYVSGSDNRIQWITTTGNTRLTDGTKPQQIRKQRFYYFGLDTSICTSSDSYTGLACRVELQDNSSNVFTRTDYTYVSSGSTAGLLKTTKRHRKTSDGSPLTTTYADHNAFGLPDKVTDEASVVTDIAYNGWAGITSVTENDVLLDDQDTPGKIDRTTSYSYNKLRRVDTITLPKGNKRKHIYYTGSTDYARLKAFAKADASGNLLEILKYDYDKFGHRTEAKILDSIDGSTPCADEDCTTYETRSEWEYDAAGRILKEYLHATDTSDPADATMTFTYTNGQLTAIDDFLGNDTDFDYDDNGRLETEHADADGVDAETDYTYDENWRVNTVTAPAGVVTTTEVDDFGQLVLERSKTRGDIHREYDTAGRLTERRRTPYNSTTSSEYTCWDYDWLGRQTEIDKECNSTADWTFEYDGTNIPSGVCVSGTVQTGRLSTAYKTGFKRVICYHPMGLVYGVFQRNDSSTWAHSSSLGTRRIYDANLNLDLEFVHDRPDTHQYSRHIDYVYDSTLKDRIDYVRHKLDSAGSWTEITTSATDPTHFAFGGIKTIKYANNIVETNTHDKARQLTRRKTDDGSTTYTDINLTYDDGGNITLYDDSSGYRHLKYYTAYDGLNRLRCVSRGSISSCSGTEPWEDTFEESFDYDKSGNRTNRRYGEYNSSDDDAYTYVTDSDIIDKVTSGGTDKEMSNDMKGDITSVNQPNYISFTWDYYGRLGKTNDNYQGDVTHSYAEPWGDRFKKVSVCNSRETHFYYSPMGSGAASYELKLIDLFDTCESEYPRNLRAYVYLEGRPIAVAHSTRASGSSAQTEGDTYWVHTDQIGTPVLVTDDAGTEVWRWENDPFGRKAPIEFEVKAQDVDPDDDTSSGSPPKYNTCCCNTCGDAGSGCNNSTSSCSAGCCADNSSQDVVWSQTYQVSGANNIRLHFSAFDLEEGSTRTGKDYAELKLADSTVIATLTGALGAFWGPWAGEGEDQIDVELTADYSQASTRGFVIDKLEYTDDTGGRYVMDLRMPGQIWDADAVASSNFQRWYRSEDGRYVSPDPLGLAGGDASYHSYSEAGPMVAIDPTGEKRECYNTWFVQTSSPRTPPVPPILERRDCVEVEGGYGSNAGGVYSSGAEPPLGGDIGKDPKRPPGDPPPRPPPPRRPPPEPGPWTPMPTCNADSGRQWRSECRNHPRGVASCCWAKEYSCIQHPSNTQECCTTAREKCTRGAQGGGAREPAIPASGNRH